MFIFNRALLTIILHSHHQAFVSNFLLVTFKILKKYTILFLISKPNIKNFLALYSSIRTYRISLLMGGAMMTMSYDDYS